MKCLFISSIVLVWGGCVNGLDIDPLSPLYYLKTIVRMTRCVTEPESMEKTLELEDIPQAHLAEYIAHQGGLLMKKLYSDSDIWRCAFDFTRKYNDDWYMRLPVDLIVENGTRTKAEKAFVLTVPQEYYVSPDLVIPPFNHKWYLKSFEVDLFGASDNDCGIEAVWWGRSAIRRGKKVVLDESMNNRIADGKPEYLKIAVPDTPLDMEDEVLFSFILPISGKNCHFHSGSVEMTIERKELGTRRTSMFKQHLKTQKIPVSSTEEA